MRTNKALSADVLHLRKITLNPRISALLSSEFVHRYRALPIAMDGGRVTVAMAHPEDPDARQAVMGTLGPFTCMIRADEQEIERLIYQLWPKNAQRPMKILSWFPDGTGDPGMQQYAESLTALFKGELYPCELSAKTGNNVMRQIVKIVEQQQPDLLVFRYPDASLIKRIFLEAGEQPYVEKLPTSLLVTRQPRWPIRKILLILHNSISDEAAVKWCIRLAGQAQAHVTILPLMASAPAMFASLQARQSLPEILGRDCALGNQLRQAAQQLVDCRIEGTLRLRDEPPDQQVRCEIYEGDYDILVMGAETMHPLARWVLGQLVNPLLYWADRPVLIAKTL